MNYIKKYNNLNYKNYKKTFLYTILILFFSSRIKRKLRKYLNLILSMYRNISYIKSKKTKTVNKIKSEFFKRGNNEICYNKLPEKGFKKEQLLSCISEFKYMNTEPIKNNKISGTVYTNDKNLSEVILKSIETFQYTNPLHSDLFPGLQRMESSIVNMCLELYKGNKNSIGNITSGGTESILMTCKAHRDFSKHMFQIDEPEIIISKSAHVAFNKAAHYLGIKLVIMDEIENRFDINALKNTINSNTILVVGSAPSFPHGVIDPVQEIGDVVNKYNLKNNSNIGFHIDACLGGFILPFKEKINSIDYKCNFKNINVTSISMDAHKYGYSPKGSSIIMYKNKKLAHYQYYVEPDWPGGIYISPNMAGSRSGAIIAGTWASLMYHGYDGYIDKTKKILEIVDYIYNELLNNNQLIVNAKPDTTVISFSSKKFNIYVLGNLMGKLNWNLNALQFSPGLHICITGVHTMKLAKQFIKDINSSIENINKNNITKTDGMFEIYGTSQKISDRTLIKEIGYEYLDAYYE